MARVRHDAFNEMFGDMGTRFRIILYAADEATAKRASAAAFKRIAELDGIMGFIELHKAECMSSRRFARSPALKLKLGS